jgi:putative endonuclease
MTQARLTLGKRGEEAAALYLEGLGMRIIERNFTTPVGEIDLVARHRKSLIFVEVKTRRGLAYGSPAEAVGRRKQQQIIRTAKWYLNHHGASRLQPRFDVVAVLVDGERLSIEHIPDAFQL